jgi:hypothetical protein
MAASISGVNFASDKLILFWVSQAVLTLVTADISKKNRASKMLYPLKISSLLYVQDLRVQFM